MRNLYIYISLLIAILAFSHCENQNSTGNSGKEINAKRLFTQYCVLCHGADGKKGLNKAADLSTSSMSIEERLEIITHGRNLMTPFRGVLSPEEINAVAQYTMELSDAQ